MLGFQCSRHQPWGRAFVARAGFCCIGESVGTDALPCRLRTLPGSRGLVGLVVSPLQLSAAKFFSNLLPLLEGVPVVSARSLFEAQFPGSPLCWKVRLRCAPGGG